MTTPSTPSSSSPSWQPEKHLQSGDRFWILTDIERYSSAFYAWSAPQELFRVGIYDLKTECVGYANFGKDIGFVILKAGVTAPPWRAPMAVGIELHRAPHEGEEKGRYKGWATILDLEPEVLGMAGRLKARFAHGTSTPNALPGMWDDLAERATSENAIEAAVESMRVQGEFSAGDIKKIVGNMDVTPVLRNLVARGVLLPPTGKKRGTRYKHAPSVTIIARADWTD